MIYHSFSNLKENKLINVKNVNASLYHISYCNVLIWRKYEDTNGVIRRRKEKNVRQYNGHKKKDKKQTMIYKTLRRLSKNGGDIRCSGTVSSYFSYFIYMFNYNNVKFRTNIADAFLVYLEQTKYILSTHPEQQYSTILRI